MTRILTPPTSRDRDRSCRRSSAAGEGGYFATAFVVLVAVTALACLSLLVDGGRITTARRHADTTAFQAARAAVQHLDPTAGRDGQVLVGPDANTAADTTVHALLTRAGLNGRMTSVRVSGNQVTVTVEITRTLTASALFGHPTATVTGTGSARVGAGVTSEETP